MDQEMDEHRKQEPKEQFTETEFPMANNLQLERPYFSCAANGRNVMRTSSQPRFQGFSFPPDLKKGESSRNEVAYPRSTPTYIRWL